MRRVVKLGALVFLALMLLATMPRVGLARIRAAKLEDLVGNSDLIVVGKVESTRLTRPALWRRVALTASLGVFATGVLLMLRKKRKTLAAVLVCISLLGLLEFILRARRTRQLRTCPYRGSSKVNSLTEKSRSGTVAAYPVMKPR